MNKDKKLFSVTQFGCDDENGELNMAFAVQWWRYPSVRGIGYDVTTKHWHKLTRATENRIRRVLEENQYRHIKILGVEHGIHEVTVFYQWVDSSVID